MNANNLTKNELLQLAYNSDDQVKHALVALVDNDDSAQALADYKAEVIAEHVSALAEVINQDMQEYRFHVDNLADYYDCLLESISYRFDVTRLDHILDNDVSDDTLNAINAYFKSNEGELTKSDKLELIEIIDFNELFTREVLPLFSNNHLILASMQLGEDEQENQHYIELYCNENLPLYVNTNAFKEAFYKEQGEYSYYHDHDSVAFKLDEGALIEYLNENKEA